MRTPPHIPDYSAPGKAWSAAARRAGLSIAVWGGLVALVGCGLFTPADPDPPFGDPGGINLPLLTVDPESAIVSMVMGIEQRSQDLYMHAFANSTSTADINFHAFFDIQDLLQYQVDTGAEPPSDWINQNERTFFPLFVGLRPVNYQVILTPDPNRPDEFPDPDNDVLYFRKYRIFAQAAPMGVGVADIRIQRVGIANEWKITQWNDTRDTSDTSIPTYGGQRLNSLTFGQ
jgi:hypothetical protein